MDSKVCDKCKHQNVCLGLYSDGHITHFTPVFINDDDLIDTVASTHAENHLPKSEDECYMFNKRKLEEKK